MLSYFISYGFLNYILAVAAGIVLFLLVEKIVRYVEEHSGGTGAWGHGHHHHHHSKKLKDDNDSHDDVLSESPTGKERKPNVSSDDCMKENSHHDSQLRKVSSWHLNLLSHFSQVELQLILCQIWNCYLLVYMNFV